MKKALSLTRLEESTAEEILFLLADEARSQRKRSAAPATFRARAGQLGRDMARLHVFSGRAVRRRALALIVCRALEALLLMGNPGAAVIEALKSGDLERT